MNNIFKEGIVHSDENQYVYSVNKNIETLKGDFPESFLKIAVVGRGGYFTPYREALVEAINKFGFEAKGFDTIDYNYNPDVFLIINPFHFMDEKFNKKDYLYAGIQTEQINTKEVYCYNMGLPNYKKLQKCIGDYDFMFEWSPASYRFLKKKFDNIYFMPHCNFSSMQYSEKYPNIEERYDLIFIGWATGINNRREKLLKEISDRYNVYPKYEGLWGEEKEKAIMSSKICLNIHFDYGLVYESPRMYEYIANKKFVLSEKISDSYPFIEGEDYDSFYLHNMIQQIDYYLSNSKARLRIANNGFNKVNNYMLDKNINIILERLLLEKWIRKSRKKNLKKILLKKLGII